MDMPFAELSLLALGVWAIREAAEVPRLEEPEL
jgi:hypothetical protein